MSITLRLRGKMTTGTRLTNPSIALKISGLVFSATLWACIGSFAGHYVGNQQGFRRGVVTMTDLVLQLTAKREEKNVTVDEPRHYWDL